MIIAAALANHAAAVRRKFVGRHRTIGASEVGQCMRRLSYLKTEHDPVRGTQHNPDYVEGWGNPTRGSIFEAHYWEPALRAVYGARLCFAGKAQKTFTKGFLSATPDGLITGFDDNALAPLGVAVRGGSNGYRLISTREVSCIPQERAQLGGVRSE